MSVRESSLVTDGFVLCGLYVAWNNSLVLGCMLATLIGWAWVTRKTEEESGDASEASDNQSRVMIRIVTN